MRHSLSVPVVSLVALTLLLAVPGTGWAQSAAPTKVEGTIDDYTDAANAAGPWHISGEWSLHREGASKRFTFLASLTMVRSASGASSHTHHIALLGGTITPLANGFRLSGNAVIASNGSLAGFTGSPLDVDITGGTGLDASNIALTFGGGAAGHYGSGPIEGVRVLRP